MHCTASVFCVGSVCVHNNRVQVKDGLTFVIVSVNTCLNEKVGMSLNFICLVMSRCDTQHLMTFVWRGRPHTKYEVWYGVHSLLSDDMK